MTYIWCEIKNVFSRKLCLKLPEIFKLLKAAQIFLKCSNPIFCKALNRFSECYLLKFTRIHQGQTYRATVTTLRK